MTILLEIRNHLNAFKNTLQTIHQTGRKIIFIDNKIIAA